MIFLKGLHKKVPSSPCNETPVHGKIIRAEGKTLTVQMEEAIDSQAAIGASFRGVLLAKQEAKPVQPKEADGVQRKMDRSTAADSIYAAMPRLKMPEGMVTLREVLCSPEMRAASEPLVFALGKDEANNPMLCDLRKMPHLLVGGAKGSGKTMLFHDCICSLISRTTPEEVRLLLIDREGGGLTQYDGLPHLLYPVITDPEKGVEALSWVVQEMLDRYGKFAQQGVRNLEGYNRSLKETDKPLARIVVIIDHLPDLMAARKYDFEEAVRRMAALSRAAGIHMLVSTPIFTSDVLTGTIQNNFPSRIALAVPSADSSRKLLDVNGAEKLQPLGELIYRPIGQFPIRGKGCFVREEEIAAFVQEARNRCRAEYDAGLTAVLARMDQMIAEREKKREDEKKRPDWFAALLRQAIVLAIENREISLKAIQQELRVGYAVATRLIDEMEKRGIISPANGSLPRKTLMTEEEWRAENLDE